MNLYRVEGNWKQLSGQLKALWGRLTRDPARELAGRRDQIAGRALQRYGISQERVVRQLREFRDRNRDWYPSNR
jgi:uncharacterized protein YjbJ (UPF0337 family)